ncbi:MAG: Phosphoribosylformylglycinamidine synthase, PurS subunit, partial [uncultured Rubrobacteraceae bacterium]
ARYLEDPGPGPSQGGHPRPSRGGGAWGPARARVRWGKDRSHRASDRDGGRERGRGGRHVPPAALQSYYRGVRVGGGLV